MRGNLIFPALGVLFASLAPADARAQLIHTVDYSDTFTLGANGRANGVFNAGSPAEDVEDLHGNALSTWTPGTNFSFNDIPGSINPDLLAAAAGNDGAATGLAQSGGG